MRKQSDVWALGRVLSATAGASCHEEERLLLGSVAADAAAVKLPRIPLHEVVSRLSLTSGWRRRSIWFIRYGHCHTSLATNCLMLVWGASFGSASCSLSIESKLETVSLVQAERDSSLISWWMASRLPTGEGRYLQRKPCIYSGEPPVIPAPILARRPAAP